MDISSGVIGSIRGEIDGEELTNLICKGVAMTIVRAASVGVFQVSFGETIITDYVAIPAASNSSDYSASLHARIPSQGVTDAGFQLEVLNEAGEFVDPKLLQVAILKVPQ